MECRLRSCWKVVSPDLPLAGGASSRLDLAVDPDRQRQDAGAADQPPRRILEARKRRDDSENQHDTHHPLRMLENRAFGLARSICIGIAFHHIGPTGRRDTFSHLRSGAKQSIKDDRAMDSCVVIHRRRGPRRVPASRLIVNASCVNMPVDLGTDTLLLI